MDVKEKNDYRKFKEGLLVSQSTLDYWFEEGMERGIVKGIEKGIEKGIKQGIEKGIEQGIEKGIEQGIAKGVSLGAQQQQALNVSRLFQKGFEAKEMSDFLEIDFAEVIEILEKKGVSNC